jgi:DMSO reductase family type II enzyme chaperone
VSAAAPTIPGPPGPRALLYLAYARLLGFPDERLVESVARGEVAREAAELHTAADFLEPSAPLEPRGGEGLEPTYIATFEVGVPEPPVPLYESAYAADDKGARRALLEELVRFYEFFDLDLGESPSEAPDHVTVELEFLAGLAQLEHLATLQGADPTAFRLAQRDFLDRHLVGFLRRICSRPVPRGFYRAVLEALRGAVEADWARLGGSEAGI